MVMSGFPLYLKRFPYQVLFFVGVPVFFIDFTLFYQPFDMKEFLTMGRWAFTFNIPILTAIIFACILPLRVLYFRLAPLMDLNWGKYALWCSGETFISSCFCAMYITLMRDDGMGYFEVLGHSLWYMYCILMFPYLIFSLLLANMSPRKGSETETGLVRFTDSNKKEKLVIAPEAILYIEAEENYVRIHYLDSEKERVYVLRNSMKALETLAEKHGIVRCQRSFYVNPSHIKVLRKDKDGVLAAELDVRTERAIPISKTYYDSISSLL